MTHGKSNAMTSAMTAAIASATMTAIANAMTTAMTISARRLPIAALSCLVALPAAAHHSFAMYDRTQSQTLTGKLTRFIPGANHAQLIFELVDDEGEVVVGDDGRPLTWGVEMAPAAQIADQGITVASFPAGTIVTVTLNPLRDGRPFGALAGPVIRCGTTLPAGGCTASTGESFGGQ